MCVTNSVCNVGHCGRKGGQYIYKVTSSEQHAERIFEVAFTSRIGKHDRNIQTFPVTLVYTQTAD